MSDNKSYYQLEGIEWYIRESDDLIEDYHHFLEEVNKTFGRHTNACSDLVLRHPLWVKWRARFDKACDQGIIPRPDKLAMTNLKFVRNRQLSNV